MRKWLFTFLKVAIAVLGLWYVAQSLTWNDSATLPAEGPAINTVTFVQDTKVTVLETHTDAAGRVLVRIRFPSKPVKVRIETSTGPHEFDLLIDDDTVIPGTLEKLALRREIDAVRDA